MDLSALIRGVSGLDKTNKTESSNRTKLKKYPSLFGSVWNRSKPIETDLIWFGSWFFISRFVKPMNQSDDNHTPYFTNIILPHTNLWLNPKLNIKYFLIHSLSLIFILSHPSDSFVSTKKEILAVNHTKPIVHRHRSPLRSFISWLVLSGLCQWFILILFHCSMKYFVRMMDEWILDHMYEILSKVSYKKLFEK